MDAENLNSDLPACSPIALTHRVISQALSEKLFLQLISWKMPVSCERPPLGMDLFGISLKYFILDPI